MTSAAGEPALPPVGFAGRLSLVMLTPLVALAQVSVTPILPKISAHFAAVPEAEALVRVLITGMLAAQIIGAIIAGQLGGRVALRKVVLAALGVYAVAGAAGYVIDNLYVLIASRIIVGGAAAAALIAMLSILTTQVPGGLRDRWLGFNIVAGTFGAVVLTPLAGWIGSMDWRAVFLLHLLALPIMALIAFVVPEAPPLARKPKPGRTRVRFPVVIVLMSVAVGACLNAGGAFFPYYFREIGSGSPALISIAVMVIAFASGALGMAYGALRKRFSVTTIFVAGFLINAAGLLLLTAFGTFAGAMLGTAIAGIGLGLLAPNIYAAAANATPPADRPGVLGFVRAGVSAGPLLAQIPLEPVAHSYGAQGVIITIGLFSLALILVVRFVRSAFFPVPD